MGMAEERDRQAGTNGRPRNWGIQGNGVNVCLTKFPPPTSDALTTLSKGGQVLHRFSADRFGESERGQSKRTGHRAVAMSVSGL
ncbi:hypothetical protein ACOMHN_009726 [Nucella lapillus]